MIFLNFEYLPDANCTLDIFTSASARFALAHDKIARGISSARTTKLVVWISEAVTEVT